MIDVPDAEVWTVRRLNRERLVRYARRRLRQAGLAKGIGESQLAWTDQALDPDALTIGFARRFATYKRADLLLRDPDRLRRAAARRGAARADRHRRQGPPRRRPRQGAAPAGGHLHHRPRHPPPARVPRGLRHLGGQDARGRRRRVAQQPAAPAGGVRHVGHEGGAQRRAQLLDARRLVGRDVRRRRRLGHPVGRVGGGPSQRDEIEGNSLYTMLEREIVPLFYERDQDGLPAEWLAPGEGLPRPARPPGRGVADAQGVHDELLRARRRPQRGPAGQPQRTGQGPRPLEAVHLPGLAVGRGQHHRLRGRRRRRRRPTG